MNEKKVTVVLGVTGSIAAYKAADLLRRMQARDWDVWVMMTTAAAQYVGPLTFQALSRHPVAVGPCEAVETSTYQHLDLAGRADVVVLAPCTANVIAKLAHGLADDVIGATVLASTAPLILAPAMNEKMWLHPATRENVAVLRRRDVEILDVEEGALACGIKGVGRLCALDTIVEAVARRLKS